MSNDEIIKYSRLTPAIFICLVSNLPFVLFYASHFWIRRRACERWIARNLVAVVARKTAPKIISYYISSGGVRVHVKWDNVCAHIFLTLWLFRCASAFATAHTHAHTAGLRYI